MTATIGELVALVDRLAPVALASDWDNVGLLVGRPGRQVARVLVALDLRDHVVAEAQERGCEAILVHHPPIFPSIETLTERPGREECLLASAEAGIAVIAAHTNLDACAGGLNDVMGELLGLEAEGPLEPSPHDSTVGLGRVAACDLTVGDLVRRAGEAFAAPVRFIGDGSRPVRRVAWCTGSGGSFAEIAENVADAYVTGDLRYHDHDAAPSLALVDVPHAAVESRCLAIWSEQTLTPAAEAAGVRVRAHPRSTDPWSQAPSGGV